ncbi:TetR family transcriptional regulator [Mesorhizobium sp. L-8-10]|uniref:TetR/AcrR family transcriptional regulator n=1 Tax=Mesorhizobium sp. L-8-10 TaxID=2744523 RepID=UPI001926A2B7|nr:TetR/AcrR family transcriptional regulator [Mesorhizobium sp. L-8-10]BCH28494.1 TetR family transcriptional regulator [Mesorhizobium sp. L-8-10]
MAIDRRVARTRRALYDALVALIRRKPYEEITVEDILREADVGRATFYAHFTTKDDLLERSLDRLRDLLLAAQGYGETAPFPWDRSWSPSRVLFEHIAEFADVRFALSGGRGGPILRDAVDRVLAGVFRAAMPREMAGSLPRELVVLHIVSTVNATLRWWLEHHPDMSAAEIDALFARLLTGGLPEASCAFFLRPAALAAGRRTGAGSIPGITGSPPSGPAPER